MLKTDIPISADETGTSYATFPEQHVFGVVSKIYPHTILVAQIYHTNELRTNSKY
jgi:hypothetical protein